MCLKLHDVSSEYIKILYAICSLFIKLRENHTETDAVMETLGSSLVAVSKRGFPEIKTAESVFISPNGSSHRYFLVLVPTAKW